MRASNGFYAEKLDHMRALAVFLVFFWHFVHGSGAHPLVPFDYAPPTFLFPLSLFEQGQIGVALFMVLSGYLFSRIVGDGTIAFMPFIRNRALRLLPLLAIVVLPGLLTGRETPWSLVTGFLHGWAADGTWSVAVEFQFYLVFPIILAVGQSRLPVILPGLLLVAILVRLTLWSNGIDLLEPVAYSLLGRADNFLVGMTLAVLERRGTVRSPWLAGSLFVAFLGYCHAFNLAGGLSLPAHSAIWIIQPTIESVGFAALIHLYCASTLRLPEALGKTLVRVGEYSYSIYLLHFAIVLLSARFVAMLVPATDFWLVSLLALPVFAMCVMLGGLSYNWIEKPFLRLRIPYLRAAPVTRPGVMSQTV